MSALFHEFRNGGWPNFLILLLGLFGFVLGVAAAVVAAFRSRAGRVLGAVAAGLAIVILGTGALGVMFGHRATDRALAGAGISAVQSERIQREGYLESKSCAEFGLGAALFPLLGGAIALLASRRQGLALPGAMLGIAALVAAGDAALVAQKLPGHDYPIDDPVWSMLEAKEDIDGGQVRQGCERLESSLGARSADGTAVGDPSRLPDFERLAGVCMDARIDAALEDGPGALGELLTGTKPEMLDEAHRKRIHDELAKLEPLKIAHDGSDVTGLAMLPGMGATAPDARVRIRAHGVSVNGRLPPELRALPPLLRHGRPDQPEARGRRPGALRHRQDRRRVDGGRWRVHARGRARRHVHRETVRPAELPGARRGHRDRALPDDVHAGRPLTARTAHGRKLVATASSSGFCPDE